MANAVNGNTVYIDSTGSLDIPEPRNIKVLYIVLTPTAASAQLTLRDDKAIPTNKIDIRWPNSDETTKFLFEEGGIVFPNGINVGTINNAVATVVFSRP